jgi:beta-xylosidase
MIRRFALITLSLMTLSTAKSADAPSKWGDQGDGTYRNPVLPSDYSDLDCIRVGEDYYAISSTMQFSPGMIILHSKDLVNWTIVGHAIADLTQIGPDMNWDRMNRYGRGVWAGAIRYAKERFWIYFGTPDEGYFMTSASSPSGPWEPLHPLMKGSGWDDCCPFWDNDGQGYFVGTHFADNCKTYIWRLTSDGKGLIEESRTLINEGGHREANKLLKVKGTYYHLFSEVIGGVRVVMMQRSKNIMGPYTERRQLTAPNREANEPNQGGIVDTIKGNWFFFTHHGNGDWEGRAASLLPVTWVDGWPIIGQTDTTGKPGLMTWSGKKPLAGNIVTPQSSDDFGTANLGVQWEWNYQPRADKWSLTERPGFLRLHAFRPLRPDDLMSAGNTLTQRCFRTSDNRVVLKLDLSGLADGQNAGLCHFAKAHSALGVVQDGKVRRIEYRENGQLTAGPEIKSDQLWLKSTWGLDGRSRYAYSTDGISFTDFGPEYQLSWGNYRGDRIGIYSFNNRQDAGHVDFDFLNYNYAGQNSKQLSAP